MYTMVIKLLLGYPGDICLSILLFDLNIMYSKHETHSLSGDAKNKDKNILSSKLGIVGIVLLFLRDTFSVKMYVRNHPHCIMVNGVISPVLSNEYICIYQNLIIMPKLTLH
jgi:hypothetical protein